MRSFALATAMAVAAGAASVASAASVDVSTGITGVNAWKYTGFVDYDGNAGNNNVIPTVGVGNTAAVITPNAAWTGLSTGSPYPNPPQWISAFTNGNSTGAGGMYTYETTISLSPGTYVFKGSYSSDNMVVSFLVNNQELVTSQPSVTEFLFAIPVTITSSNPSIKLAATVWNSFDIPSSLDGDPNYTQFNNGKTIINLTQTPGYSQNDANPTGFILAGTVAPVPLPAAAWGGMTLLGVLGASQAIRRRAMAK